MPRNFLRGMLMAAAFIPVSVFAQPAHIFGIHDHDPMPTDWINQSPGGTAWITATEAIGANPNDMGGKVFNPPTGSKVIARLNYGYFPTGTIPPPAQFSDFAQRVANYVAASSNCDTWVIGNETNLAAEWPNDGNNNLITITPEMYADLFQQCYNAIKAVRPNDKVLVQALAPWAGPYGPGNLGGYSHAGQGDNWADYKYKMLTAITTGPNAVIPDGIATHINSRGYNPSGVNAFNGPWIRAAGLTLNFSWGVYRDWIQFGIPMDLWDLPLYATESNGLYYWKGGGPESSGDPAYVNGWLQAVYSSVDAWNQTAAQAAMPIYRCVNMYRWGPWDDWSIDAAPNRATILSDLAAAAAEGPYNFPAFGGNALRPGNPGGVRIDSGITPSASSQFDGNHSAAHAFDGDTSTKWTSLGTSMVHWLAADLGSEKEITGYIVRHAQSGGEPNYLNTIGFYIETRNDPSEPWATHVMFRTNTPGTNPPPTTELVYDTPVTARYVRLFVNAPNSQDNFARIPGFEIYEDATESSIPGWTVFQ